MSPMILIPKGLATPQGTRDSAFCANTTGGATKSSPVGIRKLGAYPILSKYYNAFNHSNLLNTKVYRVDFTNWCFYCHAKDSIGHIVWVHNAKGQQRGAFYYLVQ